MPTISKTGITTGQTIAPDHVLRIINALDGTNITEIVISGSLKAMLGFTGSLFGTASHALTASSAPAYFLRDGSGTMAGNVNFTQTNNGLVWNVNSDGASIKFYNTGDGDTDARLEFNTSDNNNEYFRWTHAGIGIGTYESMKLIPNGIGSASLFVSGTIYSSKGAIITGSLNVTQGVTGSFTGSFKGDGSQITGVTGEWDGSHNGNASITASLSIGSGSTASGLYSHAEGIGTVASGSYSHAEGGFTTALTTYSHAEGGFTTASAQLSHAEGFRTNSSGNNSHAEGEYTISLGLSSHAEGTGSVASGSYSHAEGQTTIASGVASHAEGTLTRASGNFSHAEGRLTTSSGDYSH